MVKNLSKRILSLAAACALLLMPIFSSPVFAAEENVIPDAAFKAKLNSAIDYMRPADHDITKEELGKLTAIVTAEDLGIKSVEGIQYATKVKSLYVGNNQIADLTPISKMPQLEGLGIEKNGIKEISLLSSLKNLTALYARNNELTDIAPLASMTELKELKISGNKISDLSALKGLTKLNDVDLDNNAIYDLTPLKDCKDLKVYNFSAEKLSFIIKSENINRLNFLSEISRC